jgi:uncharacterized membrane protein HdeD (DUF308 family)
MTTSAALGDTRLAPPGRFWWVFLVTGTLWILFSIIVLRFDYTTVKSISILFGIAMLAAAAIELFAVFVVEGGWWKVAHGLLSLVFLVIGIVSFVHPGNTFVALAAVMSFAFIFKGIFDLITGIVGDVQNRWLPIVIGLVEIGVGFWAAGNFGNAVILLVVWVGLTALFRGITEIIFAFSLRSVTH